MKTTVLLLGLLLTSVPAAAQMMSPGSSSSSSEPSSAEPAPPSTLPMVNLNAASIEELCTLPGIGRKKAEAIVALRQKKPLTRVTQLLQVKGIGAKTLQRLKPMLSVAPVPAVESAPAVSGSPIMAAVRRP